MVSRVAVTGVNGFVGPHLVNELLGASIEVVGIGREDVPTARGLAAYVSQDLTRGWPKGLDIDAVVHLAGLSAVGPSFEDPQRYISQNSAMVTNICEGILTESPGARLLVVSSGAVYDARQDQPLTETSRVAFTSPYVVSKALVESQILYYASRGMDAVVARPFNHIGPGQGPGFLVPDLQAAACLSLKNGGSLCVGDLDTRRDYTDVRDVARAYRMLLEVPTLEDRLFNVCSGLSWSGREILALLELAWGWQALEVTIDQDKIRPSDPGEITGSNARIRRVLGWQPKISIDVSVRDFVAS